MMHRSFLLLLTPLFILLSSCARDDNSDGRNHRLDWNQFYKDSCLNIEALSEYIATHIDSPSRVTVENFKPERNSPLLTAAHFGVFPGKLQALPYLKKIKSVGCETVVATTSYGRELHYKVVEQTKTSFTLERDVSLDTEAPEKVLAEANQTDPEIRYYRLETLSPTSMRITVKSDLITSNCKDVVRIPYEKTATIRWGSAASWPDKEVISLEFLNQVDPAATDFTVPVARIKSLQDTLLASAGARTCGAF